MEPGNQALNLLQQILQVVEFFVTDQANQLDSLQENYIQGKNPYIDQKINNQTDRLLIWIERHEQLQNKFAELLQHLQNEQERYIEKHRATAIILAKLQSMELMNKDALFWKQRAEYMEATRKVLYNELTRVKNDQKD